MLNKTFILFSMILMLPIISFNSFSDSSTYYDSREKGWYWYETPPVEEDPLPVEETKPVVSAPATSATTTLTPKEIIDKQREAFDNALSAAVINPTEENIKNYLAVSKLINEQANNFSVAFKKTIWTNPNFDYSITGRPTNTQALAAYNQNKVEVNYDSLNKIADEKGIIYFFRSDCPYCARFSPLLKKFAAEFGFTVIPVSMDGVGTKDFPYPRKNDYMATRLKVEVVPATFLVNPDTNTVATIGYGYSDWTSYVAKVLSANEQMDTGSVIQNLALGDSQ